MMCAMSFATNTKKAPAPVVCMEQHVSFPFNLGGRMKHSSDTRLSYLFSFGLNFVVLRTLRIIFNYSVADLSITFCCSTYMMVRSYPIGLCVAVGAG